MVRAKSRTRIASAPHIGSVRLGTVPTVVVSMTDRDLGRIARGYGARVAELRVDRFACRDEAHVAAACRAIRRRGLALIGTVRSRAEGGAPLGEPARRSLYRLLVEEADAVDVEIAAGRLREEVARAARTRRRTVILSFHDLAGTPSLSRLRALARRARDAGADVVKIATHAATAADVCRLLEFTLAHRDQHLVTMALGPAGTISRVLFPLAGSLLTYAFVGQPTAPGQLGLAELVADLERYYPGFRRVLRGPRIRA